MAKVISDEILKLKIIVNGDEAQKRVLDLELANKRLGITLKDLQDKQSVLSRQRKKDSEEYKANERAIQSLTQSIATNKAEIDKEIKSMNIMSLTMDQLRKRARDLNFVLDNMNPNSPELAKAKMEMDELNARMQNLRNGANSSSLSIQNLAGKFNQYSGILTAALATMAGVAVSIKSTIDLNNKLADAQTSVAKTTNMSKEEVEDLTKSFSEFNTRTSKMDLLKIAEVGGRLGIPKAEIQSFTKEVNKMYVALGDSFTGGVEQVATQLGKIKNLFSETKDLDAATAFNQIGSALNELGANGAASEANIADFTLRIGALPENLKPSIAETLALGAAFEESGVDAERSGTAYSTFVRNAAKESGKFAEVMGLTKKEVDDLINKDPMQFFLKFAEGAKGLDTTEMAKMLDYLKLNDQYVISILGAASENTDRFRNSIELSNQALTEATSLQKEFDKVNNNAAAIYEKVRKNFIAMFTSETVAKTLNWLIESFGKMIGAIEDSDGKFRAVGQTILFAIKLFVIITAGVVSYNTALAITNITMATARERLLAYTVIQKLNNFLNSSGTIIQNLVTAAVLRSQVAYARLTGNTVMQTTAQARLNTITLANPYVLLVSLIVAAAAAYALFSERTDEVTVKQKILNEVRADAAQRVAEEKAELDTLLSTARNENLSKQQRLDAIKRLNAISPEYLGNLTLENIKTQDATKAVNEYVKALDRKAMAEAIQAKKTDIMKKMIEQKTNDVSAYDDFTGATGRKAGYWLNDTFRSGEKLIRNIDFNEWDKMSKEQQNNLWDKMMPSLQNAIKKRSENINGFKKELNEVNKLQTEFLTANPLSNSINNEPKSTYNTGKGTKYSLSPSSSSKSIKHSSSNVNDKKSDREKEAMLRDGEKAKELAIQLKLEEQDALAELETNWYEKELRQIKTDGMAKIADLEKQMVSQSEFKNLEEIIARSTGAGKQKFEAIKQQWMDNNESLTNLKVKQEEITDLKLKTLEEKRKSEKLRKDEEDFNLQIALLKKQSDQSIAGLNTVEQQKAFLQAKVSEERLSKIQTWEQGKQEIEQYYQEQSLQMQSDYLQNLVAQLESLPTESLTPEQLQVLESMRMKLAEIAKTKAEIQNGKQDTVDFSSLKSFENKDLLGLSSDQWKAMFTNTNDLATNINKISAAINVAQQMFATYSSFVKANEDAMLRKMEVNSNRKKKSLEIQLKAGTINQEEYKKKTLEIDAELEKKKAELSLKAAKRERFMQIASIVSGTASAVVGALGNKPWTPANFVLAGIVGGMGALQLATVLKRPLPEVTGAEDGLYPVLRSQDKKKFNARRRSLSSGIYDEPTILVGEAGKNYPEMVIDGKTMQRLKPSTVQQLNQEIAQVRGFQEGLYQDKENSKNEDYSALMIAALNRNSTIMEKLEKNGVIAYMDNGARTGRELKKSINEYDKLVNKNKYG